MKSSIRSIIILVCLFTFTHVFGQSYSFRVLANRGQNKLMKSGDSRLFSLKTGATLSRGDVLIVKEDSYVGIMHRSGKTLEVRTAGKIKVSDLENLVNTKATSITSRYAKFLAHKMNEKESPTYRSRLRATGAVSRSFTAIEPLIPRDKTPNILSDNAVIRWDNPSSIKENIFIVTVKNIFDEELMKQEVNGNSLDLNFASEQLKNEAGLYILNITAKEDPEITSGDFPLNKLNDEAKAKYGNLVDSLKSEISDNSALNKVIYAGFYEENGFIVDALTKIEEAIKLNPDIEDFKILRTDIIERNGIKIYEEKK